MEKLTQHRERRAKDGPAWSPATFRSGSKRSKKNVVQVVAAVADLDDGIDWDKLKASLSKYEWVAHSTHGYTLDNGKARVIVPFRQPVTAEEWTNTWQVISSHLFQEANDPATKDVSRMYYFPSCPPGAPRYAEHHTGDLLDPSHLPQMTTTNGKLAASAGPLEEAIPKGRRHSRLMSIAGTLRRRDLKQSEILAALRVVNLRCVPPLPEAELEQIAASAAQYEPAHRGNGCGGSRRPQIRTTGRFMRDISADGVGALEMANEPSPTVFLRGNALVRVVPGAHGPTVEAFRQASLKGALDRAADFVRVKRTDTTEEVTPTRPPDDVLSDVLATPDLRFPLLRSILTMPVFLPDCRLLSREGYDPASGYLLSLGKLSGAYSPFIRRFGRP